MEKWLPINGFEKFYQISNLGRVKSLKRKVNRIRKGKITKLTINEKILKNKRLGTGYLCVSLSKNNVKIYMSIHRLVAIHFISNPNNYKEVNHKNGIKIDNVVENLEWCTRSYNNSHAFKNGLRKHKLGINSKFNLKDIEEIRILFRNNIKIKEIVKKYKCSQAAIWRIVNNKRWKI